MPRAREYTSKYFSLSYYNPSTGNYGLGWADGHVVLFCVVLLTGLRAATMEYILAPFAKAQGISKRKDITRFSEQAWMSIYYAVFWPLGLVWLRTGCLCLFTHANRPPSTFIASPPPTSTCMSSGLGGRIAN